MTLSQQIITISVVVFGTVLTRFLAFIVFPEGKKPPQFITFLSSVLPYAVIGLLVIYCLKDAVFSEFHCLPELIAIAFVVVLHKWKKNTLLSIASGTAVYMLLVQFVF